MIPRVKSVAGLALAFSAILNATAAEQPTSPVTTPERVAEPALTSQLPFGASALPVTVSQSGDRVVVEIGGKPFTEYHFEGAPRPYCYPVLGPGGTPMTRNYPMKNDVPGEEHDHPHHRGMWFGHQSVNGQNFWTEREGNGKIVHQRFLKLAGGKAGEITSENEWIGGDGKAVCSDVRTLRFSGDDRTKIVDWEITLKATHGDVVFGDDKDGLMAVRVAASMRALKPSEKGQKPQAGDGHIVMSTGLRDDGASVVEAKLAKREAQTWGKRADWVYYYGPAAGKTVGVAIFDNPENPRHPTWWHVRDYGLFAANPFGEHFFENKPKEPHLGDFKIPAGQSATFRYRVVFAVGDEKVAGVADLYADYVKAVSRK